MNRPLRMMGTLCLLLLAVLTGRAATVNAVWDFSDEFASFETIQGTTGTFTNNGVVLTVDATNGKFRANGNSAQMNEGTLLQVPVVSTDDEVSFVAYAANYSHFTVGGEDFDGQADGSHKATAAEVKAGYVLIASTNNNSYIKSVAVTQHQPEPVLEEDLTAMWDFQHANPATLPDVHIERATGTVESTVAGVSMFVDATNGKLKGRASDAQFNANTILQIPVKSAKDIVEVTSYPGYGAGRLMVGGEEATGDVTTHKATTAEVKQGYVEVKGIQESYLYCVKVTFVSPLQEKALYETDFTDWPTINRKEAKGEEVTVTTNYSHETLTFTLTGVGSDPAGTNAKFADYTGYMISAKYPGEFADEEPYAITSPLASITKIAFTQCATGGNRGWVIAVKGDGDEDWVPVFNKSIATAGGETHTLAQPFFVIATQNPIEQYGTYPLPEAQVDRFMCQLSIGYPARESELKILRRDADAKANLRPVTTAIDILRLREVTRTVKASDDVCEYILNIVEATRTSRDLALGSSPRGGLATLALARAWALIKGRSYVVPDDIRELAPYTLRHRLILSAEAHARGKTASGVFDSILSGVHIPLGPTR